MEDIHAILILVLLVIIFLLIVSIGTYTVFRYLTKEKKSIVTENQRKKVEKEIYYIPRPNQRRRRHQIRKWENERIDKDENERESAQNFSEDRDKKSTIYVTGIPMDEYCRNKIDFYNRTGEKPIWPTDTFMNANSKKEQLEGCISKSSMGGVSTGVGSHLNDCVLNSNSVKSLKNCQNKASNNRIVMTE